MSVMNKVIDVISGATASQNHKELIRGSVLDPLNHPSYSPEKVKRLKAAAAEYNADIAAAEAKYEAAASDAPTEVTADVPA